MPRREDIKTILVIGSGPIVIGQACEFDYSGTQALKALKEEGYRVVLVNSNPATIMTDPQFADRTYIEPLTVESVRKIIERERPDVILPTIGGQTALNLTLELEEAGILEEYRIELIGAKTKAIKMAEDREKFKEAVIACGLENARSYLVRNMDEAHTAVRELGYPFVIRPSRTLGGSGGGIVYTAAEFDEKLRRGFEASPVKELLLEESLLGWKEFELEIMRDNAGNGVIICSIENVDPMGLHTGDSITVAPVQTLTDKEYQRLRDGSLKLMNKIGVDTGGSNVQFAVHPETGRVIVIELNPRVSRSSALASKATGFPIAKIAAKLAVGYRLDELPNDITKKTPACFEPSIDYVVVKIPRFDFEKFRGADQTLGTQMKSVGEVMAMGRTYPEALQKACRSLETGRTGLLGGPESQLTTVKEALSAAATLNPRRMFQIARALELGASVVEVSAATAYDQWFLREMEKIVQAEALVRGKKLREIDNQTLRQLKSLGTSDKRIATLTGSAESQVRAERHSREIRPAFKVVDTCAAEFASNTPYFYSCYDQQSDAPPTNRKKIVILGGGPNRIGQGLEFDFCCVHAVMALKEAGYETIMVNCNPETVSTDYDTADRLYFEPLTLEDVIEIVEREKPTGVIVQYGGQTPLRLSLQLEELGVPVIGTSPTAIELAEDREEFSALLERLKLRQAASGTATTIEGALKVAKKIGYPLLVRPSYVLGGRAMMILYSDEELSRYFRESVEVSFDRPVLLDRFLENAIEIDVDAVADQDEVLVCGLMEHIERAGIHSGDSSFFLPSQTLTTQVVEEIVTAAKNLAREVGVRGLMNVQFALVGGKEIYVLEVNPRASRSVPFVSKVTGIPWAKVAARVMAGESLKQIEATGAYGKFRHFVNYAQAIGRLPYVAVKQSVFPFIKFRGADAILGPEMRSTGEVMGIDSKVSEAILKAQAGASLSLPLGANKSVFFSLQDADKRNGLALARRMLDCGFRIVATKGTANFFKESGLKIDPINKVAEGSPHIVDALLAKQIHLVINTPEGSSPRLDSQSIRVTSIDVGIPLFTTLPAAEAAIRAIEEYRAAAVTGAMNKSKQSNEVFSIQEYVTMQQ
ncbi:carbamoyl-phosphate synthase large subunit [bacterium]|nr:carbamoyl-phosphate synthase large subunit [bacterium]